MSGIGLGARAIGLATAAVGLGIAFENYQNKGIIRNAQDGASNNNYMFEKMNIEQFSYSNNSIFQEWANNIKGIVLDIQNSFQNNDLFMKGIFRDFLGANFPLVAVGGIGLAVGAGDWLCAGAKGTWAVLEKPLKYIAKELTTKWSKWNWSAPPLGKGLLAAAKFAFKTPVHTLVTLAGVGALAFSAMRFNDVYTGQEYEDFNRDIITGGWNVYG